MTFLDKYITFHLWGFSSAIVPLCEMHSGILALPIRTSPLRCIPGKMVGLSGIWPFYFTNTSWDVSDTDAAVAFHWRGTATGLRHRTIPAAVIGNQFEIRAGAFKLLGELGEELIFQCCSLLFFQLRNTLGDSSI